MMLKASNGMDYSEFYNLLFVIGSRRLWHLEKCVAICHSGNADAKNYCSGCLLTLVPERHAVFDLIQIARTLKQLTETNESLEMDWSSQKQQPDIFLKRINSFLKMWCRVHNYIQSVS